MYAEEDLDPSKICRDEDCDREEIHPAHDAPLAAIKALSHGLCLRRRKTKPTEPLREPWKKSSSEILDELIEACLSDTIPKRSFEIYQDVLDEYGSLAEREDTAMRQLRYHLQSLARSGRIVQVDLGERLVVYLRRGSRLVDDPQMLAELVDAGPSPNGWPGGFAASLGIRSSVVVRQIEAASSEPE